MLHVTNPQRGANRFLNIYSGDNGDFYFAKPYGQRYYANTGWTDFSKSPLPVTLATGKITPMALARTIADFVRNTPTIAQIHGLNAGETFSSIDKLTPLAEVAAVLIEMGVAHQ